MAGWRRKNKLIRPNNQIGMTLIESGCGPTWTVKVAFEVGGEREPVLKE
jgi:hypothetical protein